MTHDQMPNEMADLAHCLRKEIEYYAKARDAILPSVIAAYEAAAREYAHQGRVFTKKL